MIRSRNRRRVVVPSVTTNKTQTKDYEYKQGKNTNLSNDISPPDNWRYITDAREYNVGKWSTRLGSDPFSIPIGESVSANISSVIGASLTSFSTTQYLAQKLTATTTGPLTSLEVNIKNANGATGTVVVALYSDNANKPGTELFRSTIAASAVTATLQYLKARSITCPSVVSGTAYWMVIFTQQGGTGSYQVSTTTNASTSSLSVDSGTSWTNQTVAINARLSTATSGGTKGVIRVRRSNGIKYTFMAHGTDLYSINETTGVTTSVDSGINTNSTYVRFAFVNDTLYYITGLQKPRKYNFTTATEVTTAPSNATNIFEHKGILFYTDADDVTREFYTNFGIYDTFTSTDFILVPAPKTGDPITAKARLNGNLYIITRNSKYILYGAQNATFQLDSAIGQKGTFSQESIVFDEDYIYLAGDDGIYRFNGAEEVNLSEDVLDWWNGIIAKENTVLELHDNRLYIYYTPNGQDRNSRCQVYNTLYKIWESEDTNTYINRSYTLFDTDNYFLQGSNRAGFVMLGERATNDYNNCGEPFTYELRTRYDHYDTPAQFKRAPLFRPHFDATTGKYSIEVGYALDYNDAPNYTLLNLQPIGATFDSGKTFNSGLTYGSAAQINPTDDGPMIPGEFRRLQIRYRKYAARQPVSFDGHILKIETQRIN